MVKQEISIQDWIIQAIRSLLREVLRDELAEILPVLLNASQSDESQVKPIDINDAAKFLGISKQTVYQNIDTIPHRKRHGRLYFFIHELTEYLNRAA